jgi:hypothetical protein
MKIISVPFHEILTGLFDTCVVISSWGAGGEVSSTKNRVSRGCGPCTWAHQTNMSVGLDITFT